MCGIAGYFGEKAISPARLEECRALMRRRGPDAAGSYHHEQASGRNVYLLHSRLKIIDLDNRANQPYRVGCHLLSYNGEIYNYVELRKALEFRGERFQTTSDTEVLMKILQREGSDGLDRCEGMWAISFYEEKSGRLTLSRDRFGEKPLFLLRRRDGIYFGSEVKFIQALLGEKIPVDDNQIKRFLVNGYRALHKSEGTFFQGVTELPSGTTLTMDAEGKEDSKRYWSPHYTPEEKMDYSDAVATTREAVIRAVGLRLRADVPLAFCLSGGVDSNTLISVAKRVFNHDVHGFTVQDNDSRYDESALVATAVSELGIRHTEVRVETEDFLPRLRRLVRQHDAPVCTISYFAHWMLMEKVAALGYRISLSGTGADEIFSGYYDHHLAYLWELRENRPALEAATAAWNKHVKPLVRNQSLARADLFFANPTTREYLYGGAWENVGFLTTAWAEPFRESLFTDSLLRNRMMNEMFFEVVPVILQEDDLNAMYFSIENRSPFLDRALFEAAARIPSSLLIRDGYAKAVLRDAMQGIIPEPIRLERRKVGFNAALPSFLDVGDPQVRAELLKDGPIFDLVRKSAVTSLLNDPEKLKGESKFMFNYVNAKLFLEEFA